MVSDWGEELSCERTDADWSLDPKDEDDRNASYIFNKANLDPQNPTHRDLLLEALLSWAPVPGAPAISDSEKLYILRSVAVERQNLAERHRPSTCKAAIKSLAARNRLAVATPNAPLGRMKTTSIERRYYSAVKEFRQRLQLDRFRRNYSEAQLCELQRLVSQR
jgi:hypothetical protein